MRSVKKHFYSVQGLTSCSKLSQTFALVQKLVNLHNYTLKSGLIYFDLRGDIKVEFIRSTELVTHR